MSIEVKKMFREAGNKRKGAQRKEMEEKGDGGGRRWERRLVCKSSQNRNKNLAC